MTTSTLLKQLLREHSFVAKLFSVFLFLIPLFLWFIRNRWSRKHQLNLPPSPPRFPILGNLHQLGTHPHRSFREFSNEYGPLMLLKLGYVPTLIVSSADMVKEIVKNHDLVFSNRPKTKAADILFYKGQDVGFAPYGEYWRQVRKICVLEILSLRRVQQFQYVQDQEAAALVERIHKASSGGGSINLSAMLIGTSNNILSRCILGRNFIGEEGTSRFGELARDFMAQLMAFSVEDYFPYLGWVDNLTGLTARLKGIFKELDSFFDEIIEDHKTVLSTEGDSNSFVGILLKLKEQGMLNFDLTQDNMKAILVDMFMGGSDTTSTTLEWTMAEMLRNPSVMKKAQEEIRRVVENRGKIDMSNFNDMNYLKCVIKETLRLHPPAPLLVPRETTASIEMAGFRVPEKTRVMINAWAVQRDPNVWDRAEEFLPERFDGISVDFKGHDFELIPFGSGRRGCPGIAFAIVSTEYIIANLLYWFDWKLDGQVSADNLDMSEVYGLTVNMKVPLNVVPVPYHR